MFGFKVICWALLFIFKLRFPPGVSIAYVIVRELAYLDSLDDFKNFCNIFYDLL
jgi:hypothetical protein